MSDATRGEVRPTLDKDLEGIARFEIAGRFLSRGFTRAGLAAVLAALALAIIGFFISGMSSLAIVGAATIVGAYMAINIGANDVANNVGPAVGSKSLSMGWALLLAAVFESAGALIGGGEVVETIASGIISPDSFSSSHRFVWAMLSALLASALWVNLATLIGAPVSTTHSIVGGVLGAGSAAAGLSAVNWYTVGGIAGSWMTAPIIGGAVAAAFLALIKALIVNRDDRLSAARIWVPVLVAFMAAVFTAYLAIKGLNRIVEIRLGTALLAGLSVFFLVWWLARPIVARQSAGMKNDGQAVRGLFVIPLIFSAALLSFAHGANDVANAVGPLAAIVHSVGVGEVAASVTIPIWTLVIGAFGISFGLLLFGPKLIRMVGREITRLNPMRAFCVALSAAVTVIVASALGLPVSSTHIAVGAVFGVGFFREWYVDSSRRRKKRGDKGKSETSGASVSNRAEWRRRKLVRRSHLMTIVAAWIITVPAAALLSATIYLLLSLVV